jgi:hypothetical protein
VAIATGDDAMTIPDYIAIGVLAVLALWVGTRFMQSGWDHSTHRREHEQRNRKRE